MERSQLSFVCMLNHPGTARVRGQKRQLSAVDPKDILAVKIFGDDAESTKQRTVFALHISADCKVNLDARFGHVPCYR